MSGTAAAGTYPSSSWIAWSTGSSAPGLSLSRPSTPATVACKSVGGMNPISYSLVAPGRRSSDFRASGNRPATRVGASADHFELQLEGPLGLRRIAIQVGDAAGLHLRRRTCLA